MGDITHFKNKKSLPSSTTLRLKEEPRGPKGDAEMGPTQTHGGTTQEGRTHGKRGIT